MPESEVVRLAKLQKARLLAREADEMRNMAQAWLKVEKSLEAEMLKIAVEMAGSPNVTEAMILRNRRFTSLLFQSRAEYARFANGMEERTAALQEANTVMGVNDAYNILQTGLNEAQIASNLNHLNARAVDISIGFGADGTPLRSLLDDSYGKATNGLLQELTDGLAKGLNPVTIARNMADGFGEPILQRALVIARTETLRAYRMGSQEQYKESGIVTQYKRLATKDDRTCLGCLMQDGEIYDTVDAFEEHPNGRCTLVPIIDGVTPPDWQSGKDWLAGLPEDRQRAIMGDTRFELYKNGTPLEDMSKHVDNDTWGGSFVPTPVGELDK